MREDGQKNIVFQITCNFIITMSIKDSIEVEISELNITRILIVIKKYSFEELTTLSDIEGKNNFSNII